MYYKTYEQMVTTKKNTYQPMNSLNCHSSKKRTLNDDNKKCKKEVNWYCKKRIERTMQWWINRKKM